MISGWLASAGLAAGLLAAGGDFHPSKLEGVELYLESTRGLSIARCSSEACFGAGSGAPLESQYCDLETFPDGCVRRWLDQSGYEPPGGYAPPEWTAGRDVGRDDHDKPGVVADCLNGHPCVRVVDGVVQARSPEIAAGQEVGPLAGAFSVFLLVRPEARRGDFYYFGHDGAELVHRVADNSLALRLGVGRPVRITGEGAVEPGKWHLLEVHRNARGRLRAVVDGWDRTPGQAIATGEITLRHLFSVGRARPMVGEVAAVMVVDRRLAEAEAQQVRSYLAELYGFEDAWGDGSPPPRRPGVVELGRRLWLDWSFEPPGTCRFEPEAGPAAVLGPDCPANAPTPAAGLRGRGLLFDGVDDEVRSSGPRGYMDELYSFTVAAWLRSDSTGDWQAILDKRDDLQDGFDLYLDPEGRGFLRIDSESLEGGRVVADGRWHHLAGVFDGERLLLYVDGWLDASRFIGPRSPIRTDRELAAGRNFAGRRDAFEGVLDALRLYGRALEPQELRALAAPGR